MQRIVELKSWLKTNLIQMMTTILYNSWLKLIRLECLDLWAIILNNLWLRILPTIIIMMEFFQTSFKQIKVWKECSNQLHLATTTKGKLSWRPWRLTVTPFMEFNFILRNSSLSTIQQWKLIILLNQLNSIATSRISLSMRQGKISITFHHTFRRFKTWRKQSENWLCYHLIQVWYMPFDFIKS